MTQLRDAKGRFISNKTNTTTINNLNKGENTMKKTAQETRMEKLAQAGIATENFFDLNLRIPLNAEVKITVNGKEMTIGQPAPIFGNGIGYGLPTDTYTSNNDNAYIHGVPSTWDIENDPVAQKIMENGYVKNTKIHRRWITAQTFGLLNYKSYRNPNRTGWECAVKDLYSYNYCIEMLLEEIRVLGILQKEDKEVFEERSRFFNGDVVVYTLHDYYNRLQKYINRQNREKHRCYKGQPYVKLSRYGSVLIKDLQEKVYNPIEQAIAHIEYEANNGTYVSMYHHLKLFVKNYYNKLPYETTKCPIWKDAFKASGAFYTLQNTIRFTGMILEGCTNRYNSEKKLYELLDEYKGEEWRLHKVLVDAIEYNHYNLAERIAMYNKDKEW